MGPLGGLLRGWWASHVVSLPPRLLEFVQSGAVFSLCWDIAASTGRGGLPPRWVQRTLLWICDWRNTLCKHGLGLGPCRESLRIISFQVAHTIHSTHDKEYMRMRVQRTPPKRSSAGAAPRLRTSGCTELPGGAATHADTLQSQICHQVDVLSFHLHEAQKKHELPPLIPALGSE